MHVLCFTLLFIQIDFLCPYHWHGCWCCHLLLLLLWGLAKHSLLLVHSTKHSWAGVRQAQAGWLGEDARNAGISRGAWYNNAFSMYLSLEYLTWIKKRSISKTLIILLWLWWVLILRSSWALHIVKDCISVFLTSSHFRGRWWKKWPEKTEKREL